MICSLLHGSFCLVDIGVQGDLKPCSVWQLYAYGKLLALGMDGGYGTNDQGIGQGSRDYIVCTVLH